MIHFIHIRLDADMAVNILLIKLWMKGDLFLW